MTSRYTDYEMPSDVRYEVPEHQVLLSFTNDCGADAFRDWWQNGGLTAFETWVRQNCRPKCVCGERGYDGMRDPPCPGCEWDNKR